MKITKDMTIHEVITAAPSLAPVFFGFGMHCLGCPSSRNETLEEAAQVHGIELDVMIEELNAAFEG